MRRLPVCLVATVHKSHRSDLLMKFLPERYLCARKSSRSIVAAGGLNFVLMFCCYRPDITVVDWPKLSLQ